MILHGTAVASAIEQEITEAVNHLSGRKPCLAVVLVGEHPASKIYVNRKTKACARSGILSVQIALPKTLSEGELLHEISCLNQNPEVDGILVQMPLPSHIDPAKIIFAIDPNKDVDGFHPLNVGKMLIGETDGFLPCTPRGIQVLLMRSAIPVIGKKVLIIGRSNIVGKPLSAMLMQNNAGGNATVTVAHRQTKNIKEICLHSEVIIVAIGIAHYLKEDMVQEGAVVIDVGINRVNDPALAKGYRIVGDADFEKLKDKCSHITPVPGGVGPMTIAMLLDNTLKSYYQRMTKASL